MRGSLVHDALYQLMRNGLLDRDEFRDEADSELIRICREDGMSGLRSWWVNKGVRWFADKATDYEARKAVLTAPDQG